MLKLTLCNLHVKKVTIVVEHYNLDMWTCYFKVCPRHSFPCWFHYQLC